MPGPRRGYPLAEEVVQVQAAAILAVGVAVTVAVAAVLAVHGVPGVGEGDLLALSPSFEVVHVFEKAPLVQGNHKGHK